MSGHSKWHSIKHKKGAADAKRGKIFTRHAHLITIAARQGGGDADMNPNLRLAIDNAKKDNVPNANIERAIQRGAGGGKDGVEIAEVIYEGYGPCGTAIVVETLTDNKNRTYTNVRAIFGKRGGNLGTSGSVAWMFDRKGVIHVQSAGKNLEDLELAAIEAGAQDLENEEGVMIIYTDPSQLSSVSSSMKTSGFEVEKAEILKMPNTSVTIENQEEAKKVMDLIEAIEDDPDVSNVYSNFDLSPELMEKFSGE